MVAFSAGRLVCPVILVISPTTWPIFSPPSVSASTIALVRWAPATALAPSERAIEQAQCGRHIADQVRCVHHALGGHEVADDGTPRDHQLPGAVDEVVQQMLVVTDFVMPMHLDHEIPARSGCAATAAARTTPAWPKWLLSGLPWPQRSTWVAARAT